MEAGDPVPADCIPPEVHPFLYRAFRELCIGRSKLLRWDAIHRYGRRYGLRDADAFERFCDAMRAADNVWHNIIRPPTAIP